MLFQFSVNIKKKKNYEFNKKFNFKIIFTLKKIKFIIFFSKNKKKKFLSNLNLR